MAWIAVGVLLYLSLGCFLAGLGDALGVKKYVGLITVALWPWVLLFGLGRYVALRLAPFWQAQEDGE